MKRRGYTEQASRQLDGEVGWPRDAGVAEKGLFAVICPQDGQVFITEEDYERQLMMPDALWTCPKCGGIARFDDDNYESYFPPPSPEEFE